MSNTFLRDGEQQLSELQKEQIKTNLGLTNLVTTDENGNVEVTGRIYSNDFMAETAQVDGTTNFNGDVYFNQEIIVNCPAFFYDDISIHGIVDIDGTLSVENVSENTKNVVNIEYLNNKLANINPSPWTLDEETGCFYRRVGTEVEWLTPPMSEPYSFISNGDGTAIIIGEYRTAERFGGKPVYTCIIDTGAAVSNNTSTKEFVSDEFRQVPVLIRDEGFAINQTGLEGRHLPYMETPSVYWSVHAERDTSNNKRVKIFERSHYARTGWKTFVQIWYTYETPFNI